MTKEEIQKNSEHWYNKYKDAEKRIAELEAENEQIKNSDTMCKLIGEQKIKVADLEAQIEKMKCCFNCKHSRTEYEHCRTDKSEKWELKEK
jgi:hypothetical protein